MKFYFVTFSFSTKFSLYSRPFSENLAKTIGKLLFIYDIHIENVNAGCCDMQWQYFQLCLQLTSMFCTVLTV